MMNEYVKEKILKVFKNMEITETYDEEKILNADYIEEEMFDSITFVLLVVSLEDEFNISIEGEDLLLENLSCFESIYNLVIKVLEK